MWWRWGWALQVTAAGCHLGGKVGGREAWWRTMRWGRPHGGWRRAGDAGWRAGMHGCVGGLLELCLLVALCGLGLAALAGGVGRDALGPVPPSPPADAEPVL